MKDMPKEEGIDHTLGLMREGYMYIHNKRNSFQSDLFETRILGQKAICMGGEQATELFYDNDKFKRAGAAPKRARQTLFGEKGVQTLDGEAHRHRKETFMSLMNKNQLESLSFLTKSHWDRAFEKWETMEQVIFYEEIKQLLCRLACEWAGVPINEKSIGEITDNISSMFEAAGTIGPKHWKGRIGRNQVEKWIKDLIDDVREGKVTPPSNSALHTFASFRDMDDDLIDSEIAAVEVINILRPIVAIAIYINFIFLALHHYPDEKEKLQQSDEKYALMFIQEVRRFYPFFPFVVARVKNEFTWKGYQFEEDTLTLLDIYGTNHDPNLWNNPEIFDPNRFANWDNNPFSFIPQGGGDYFMGHRCAGEMGDN